MGEHNERPLRHRTVPLVALLTTCAWGSASGANMSADSPIMAKLARGNGFATFTNRRHPDNRIGYRFHEHTPIVHGQVPDDNERAGIDPAEMAELERRFGKRPGVLKNELRVDDKGWVPQQWTFYMAPVADGIDLLLVVQTDQAGLNAYYGIQQCFRMSGTTNAAWRASHTCFENARGRPCRPRHRPSARGRPLASASTPSAAVGTWQRCSPSDPTRPACSSRSTTAWSRERTGSGPGSAASTGSERPT